MKIRKSPDRNILSSLVLVLIITGCLIASTVLVNRISPGHHDDGTGEGALTEEENAAYEQAVHTRRVLHGIGVAELAVLLVYFTGVLTRVRKRTAQQEHQLAQTLYMYDVQQTLFDAHRMPSLITSALRKVAENLTAETAFLFHFSGNTVQELYIWPEPEREYKNLPKMNEFRRILPQITGRLQEGKSSLIYPADRRDMLDEKERGVLARQSIGSLMLVPVLDSNGRITCVLGGINLKHRWTGAEPLECVARDFQMALTNISYYRLIHEMGMLDALTGLKNRNCYEHSLKRYDELENTALCCLYVDANGLHELNNHLGHAAGDEMLMYVSNALRTTFGDDDTYRIGGDEFVAFCCGCPPDAVEERVRRFQEVLESRTYHVSIGQAWREGAEPVAAVISGAEREMYSEKQRYYQEKGDVSKARQMNQKLEQILLEKKDADTFLSIISSYFAGAYVVDFSTDQTRALCKTPCFMEYLEQNHYRFSGSMEQYIDAYVSPGDRERLRAFLDYGTIERELLDGKVPECRYRKKDGTVLTLRIYPSEGYDGKQRETFWLLENSCL